MRIITGMHRSGTSLVARLFYEAGADMGDRQTMLQGDKWNSDGYFEQPEILDINRALIHGMWGRLAYFRLPKDETIRKRAKGMSSVISDIAAQYSARVVKEVRFCLTLPVWLENGARIHKALVCLRDPIEVAQSLKRRNRITMQLGYSLWRQHNERLLASLGDIPTQFVYYRNLTDPELADRELDSMLRFFEIDLDAEATSQLRQRCVRVRIGSADSTSGSSPAVQRLWQELLERHQAQFS
jgi:hypothetical protein